MTQDSDVKLSRRGLETPWGQVRVLDLTWMAAGPIVTTFMSHLGADVVKVESRRRLDLMRIANRSYGWADDDNIETSAIFNELAAGKRSIALDLKTKDGCRLVRELALHADVLVENMRPGKVESLGLGYDSLSKENPGLIMCSMSASGRGANQEMPGYAPIFWAEGGAAWMSGYPDGDPVYVRGPVDLHAGAFSAFGLFAALIERESTGVGRYVDCSGVEAVAALVGVDILASAAGIEDHGRSGNEALPYAPNGVYPAVGDYRWIAISVRDDDDWSALARVLEFDEEDASRYAKRDERWDGGAELDRLISAKTSSWDAPTLVAKLNEAGVPAVLSRTLEDALEDPSLHRRGSWVELDHQRIGKQNIAGLPWRITGFAGSSPGSEAERVRPGAPLLGADTRDVLSEWLGLSADDLDDLEAREIFV